MARNAWSVAGHRIEYLGRGSLLTAGGMLIDGVKDEDCRVKLSRPDYEFVLGSRRLVLKTVGESGELWSRNLLIAPSDQHVTPYPAPSDAKCGQHAEARATISCARCRALSCSDCEGPDGTHCATCLPGASPVESNEPAGPAAALYQFGGPLGKAVAMADSQLDKHVASPERRMWIRGVLYGSILLGLIGLIASLAPRS